MRTDRHRRLILVEFNELSPELMDRFINEGRLPNFKRLRDESQVFTTEASERGWELNPWVQWVTVHSGLDYCDHRLIELDEGHKLTRKRIWDVVSEAGEKVWLCGSMNIGYEKPLNGLVMPDPWATQIRPSPSLRPFFEFVRRNVLDHSTSTPALSLSDYAKFGWFMVTHGLSLDTARRIIKQLAGERVDPTIRWKRAVLLDRLQFDVFRWYFKRVEPTLSTFFCNSTAHFQHYHWREMEPHLFATKPEPEKLAAHERTIRFGYEQMDGLIGRFFDLVDSDTVLVLATAISQQPCLVYEEQGGKVMYRPRDFESLMKFAGVTEPHTTAPLMAEVFNVQLTSEADAEEVERKLRALTVEGREAIQVQRKAMLLNVKCVVHTRQSASTVVVNTANGTHKAFLELFFELEDLKSGMHHPDGILWIRTPRLAPRKHEAKVPLSSVAPTVLKLLGMPVPEHMGASIDELAARTEARLASAAV